MSGAATFPIIWPDQRRVSAAQIESWYGDADANGALCPADVYDHRDLRRAPTPDEMAKALHNAGLITLSRAHVEKEGSR